MAREGQDRPRLHSTDVSDTTVISARQKGKQGQQQRRRRRRKRPKDDDQLSFSTGSEPCDTEIVVTSEDSCSETHDPRAVIEPEKTLTNRLHVVFVDAKDGWTTCMFTHDKKYVFPKINTRQRYNWSDPQWLDLCGIALTNYLGKVNDKDSTYFGNLIRNSPNQRFWRKIVGNDLVLIFPIQRQDSNSMHRDNKAFGASRKLHYKWDYKWRFDIDRNLKDKCDENVFNLFHSFIYTHQLVLRFGK